MSLINGEIQQLQLRILELEKQQKEKDENYKKTSNYNFKFIHDILNENKTVINNKRNDIEKKVIMENRGIINKSLIDNIISNKNNDRGAYEEHRLVTYLEAIYKFLITD